MKYLAITVITALVVFTGSQFLPQEYGGRDVFGAISYPTSLDSFTNPTATSKTNSPSHATQHSNANDSIEALEAKVGVDGSAVTSSHDYKLGGVTGSDLACSLTGTETLTNKTLTSATATTPYITNPTIVDRILDSAGNILLRFTETASAVNYFLFENDATGNAISQTATGTDANVSMVLETKGSGTIDLNDTTQIGDANLNFPDVDGTNGQVIQTNGSGDLSWSSPAGVTGTTSVGTTMYDYSVDGSTAIMIFAVGQYTNIDTAETITLSYGTDDLNILTIEPQATGDNTPFTVTWFGTPSATTTDITVTATSPTTLGDTDITVLAF